MGRTLPLISLLGVGMLLLGSPVTAQERVQGARFWQPDPQSLSQAVFANGAPFTRFTPRTHALRAPDVFAWSGHIAPNTFLPPGFRSEERGSALSAARRARNRSARD